MKLVNIVTGDVLNAKEDIIAHQVNCLGVMGAGVALAVKRKYPEVFLQYSKYVKSSTKSRLGRLQVIQVDEGKFVANLFGQENIGKNSKQTDEAALESSLKSLATFALKHNLSVAMPYGIGCGYGGGDWAVISQLIESSLKGVKVTLYKKD